MGWRPSAAPAGYLNKDGNGYIDELIILDPNKPSTEQNFNDYRDADGFLMNLSYITGNPIGFPVNVAHFSGEDFGVALHKDTCGNFLITGTTSDDQFSAASIALGLNTGVVPKGDFYAVKTNFLTYGTKF